MFSSWKSRLFSTLSKVLNGKSDSLKERGSAWWGEITRKPIDQGFSRFFLVTLFLWLKSPHQTQKSQAILVKDFSPFKLASLPPMWPWAGLPRSSLGSTKHSLRAMANSSGQSLAQIVLRRCSIKESFRFLLPTLNFFLRTFTAFYGFSLELPYLCLRIKICD